MSYMNISIDTNYYNYLEALADENGTTVDEEAEKLICNVMYDNNK